MKVTTGNSVYSLKDMGDGAFLLTSTNTKYCGPYTVRLACEPRVGWNMIFLPISGPHKGDRITTTRVSKITDK